MLIFPEIFSGANTSVRRNLQNIRLSQCSAPGVKFSPLTLRTLIHWGLKALVERVGGEEDTKVVLTVLNGGPLRKYRTWLNVDETNRSLKRKARLLGVVYPTPFQIQQVKITACRLSTRKWSWINLPSH